MVDWLRQQALASPQALAAAIEVPRGAIVETLLEHGFAVFSINPKQLDRFRDRYSPAGAKDDRRDAFVLADALRTDMHCFRAVRLDEPAMIRLRELSRLEDELSQEQTRAINRLREHRIRRRDASQVQATLKSKPLTLAPGAADAAQEHTLLLLPRLRLLNRQRTDLTRRISAILEELASAAEGQSEHHDAAILLSLPGLGRKVAAMMLSEASQAIAERDYHALRCYSGAAPHPEGTRHQSGKKKVVLMRRGCNERLRNALYHCSRTSIVWDPASKAAYAQLRVRGHSHGRALRGMADRWFKVLIAMLRNNTLYDIERRTA